MKNLLLLLILSFLFIGYTYSQDGIGVWTLDYNNNSRIWDIAIDPVNQNNLYIAGIDSGVYKSTNGGLNWFAVNSGLNYKYIQCIAISKSNPNVLYAGTDSMGSVNSGVYKTTDGGGSWTLVMNGITAEKSIQWISVHPSNPDIAYCAVFNALAASTVGLYKTTNGGANWFPSSNGMVNKNILCVIINPLNPNVLYAGSSLILPGSTGPSTMYKSYDAGANWFAVINGLPQTSTDNNPVRCLSISDVDTSVVLAGLFMNAATGGMYLTTNGGQSWVLRHTGLPTATGTLPRSCIIKPGSSTEMYVGLDRSTGTDVGVRKTTDAGLSWTDFSGGSLLNTYTVRALAFKIVPGLHTLFAGCASTAAAGRGIHNYGFTVSGITGNNSNPDKYTLSQNYPNPFNPVTSIDFTIPEYGFVVLKVYDVLGREVALLVNEYKSSGYYSINFDASGLNGGAYFYRLESGAYSETRKMMLIK